MHQKLHLFPYFPIYTCVLGTQKNRLIEAVLLSTLEYPQHMFWLRNKKIIFQYTLLFEGIQVKPWFQILFNAVRETTPGNKCYVWLGVAILISSAVTNFW